MTRPSKRAEAIIRFLQERILHDPDHPLDETTPLVSSGLIDSFSLIEVLSGLETITGEKIPGSRVSPEDLDTVRSMLETVDRMTRQKENQ